jgi:Cu-processing system permease protein
MNSRIRLIAANTFREAVRDRVLYNLIAFALLMSGAAVIFGQISIDIERLVVVNLGLTAISLFGVVIAIFIGIGLVSKEIEKRTLYTMLSRPVRRWELYFIVLEFLVVTALALLFSSFSSPLMSSVFAFSLFVIGSFAEDLRGFAAAAKGVTHWIATAAAYLVPNLSALNVIGPVAHGETVAGNLILYNTAYALLYSALATCGAVLIFERRNLK